MKKIFNPLRCCNHRNKNEAEGLQNVLDLGARIVLRAKKAVAVTKILGPKDPLIALTDLQGNPYKFYRGKGYAPIGIGRFFCSNFDQAKSFLFYENEPIIETEIAVSNPLVIDATEQNGHGNYNNLDICNCKLYPADRRAELMQYAKYRGRDRLSTDEVGKWARKTGDFDAVIIKNVVEGNNIRLPVYDVFIWCEQNMIRTKDVRNDIEKYELFRDNSFKRVDLSAYIEEMEQDGIVSVTAGEGYVVRHRICREQENWYMEHELLINSTEPVKIYCYNTGQYMTGNLETDGIYSYAHCLPRNDQFIPHNGVICIRDVTQSEQYEIHKVGIA